MASAFQGAGAFILSEVPALQAMFPDVDFTEIHFARHLLRALRAASRDRFRTLAAHLRAVWIERMIQLPARIERSTVLLWVANHARCPMPHAPMRRVSQGLAGPVFAPLDLPATEGLPDVPAR